MTRNKTVRAVFGMSLGTTTVGGGSLVVDPVSSFHPYGSEVQLTPVPVSGNYHAFWANAAAGRTNNPLLVEVTNANPTVTAVFASLGTTQTNALTVIPAGRGQVTLTPPGDRYRVNTNLVLQAFPDAGQEFPGWSGGRERQPESADRDDELEQGHHRQLHDAPLAARRGRPGLARQDGFRLTLTGEFGALYQLFGSPDLSGWTALGTASNAWGPVQFTDPAGTNQPWRFYRALSVP
jgi:hypothetical protein